MAWMCRLNKGLPVVAATCSAWGTWPRVGPYTPHRAQGPAARTARNAGEGRHRQCDSIRRFATVTMKTIKQTCIPRSRGILSHAPPHFFAPLQILVDSEGIDAYNQTAQDGVQLLSMAVLLSSMFVFNQMGPIDEAAIDRLGLVTEVGGAGGRGKRLWAGKSGRLSFVIPGGKQWLACQEHTRAYHRIFTGLSQLHVGLVRPSQAHFPWAHFTGMCMPRR
jgi:hypothetical protein